ncbi:S-adenosyl-L-methionine-dependent methyltransferase [Aspergillus floccosus]
MRGLGMKADAESLSRFTFGVEHVFELMEKDPQLKKSFHEYMFVQQQWYPSAWFEIYPPAQEFANLHCGPTHALIVDIGGDRGQKLVLFMEQYPNHQGRLILQDLPSTSIGASIYIFRHTIHDWSDPKAEHILRQLVSAMDPEKSTLLIVDRVMPEERAKLRDVELDMLMWRAVGGVERTETQWERLLRNAGPELINVRRSPRLGDSVLEARLAGR